MFALHRARHAVPMALVLAVLQLFATLSPAGRVTASALPDSLRACTQESDSERRLACFDREMARLIAKSDSSIGLTPKQERQLEVTGSKQDSESRPSSIPKPQVSATITNIIHRSDGRQLISLDNGEIWLQGEAYDSFNARPGESVHIRPGLLGSFYMHAASGVDTRVIRQR